MNTMSTKSEDKAQLIIDRQGLRITELSYDLSPEKDPSEWAYHVETVEVIGWFMYGGDPEQIYPAIMVCGTPYCTGSHDGAGLEDGVIEYGVAAYPRGCDLDEQIAHATRIGAKHLGVAVARAMAGDR